MLNFARKYLFTMSEVMKYQVPDESPVFVGESPACAVTPSNEKIRKVNLSQMMAEGYLTLEQSKSLIEKKIYNHFHS